MFDCLLSPLLFIIFVLPIWRIKLYIIIYERSFTVGCDDRRVDSGFVRFAAVDNLLKYSVAPLNRAPSSSTRVREESTRSSLAKIGPRWPSIHDAWHR